MTPRKKRRLFFALFIAAGAALTVGLSLAALRENLLFFLTPSEVAAGAARPGEVFRMGGLVEPGSMRRDGVDAHFRVTDNAHSVPASYRGVLPDLFREGAGVVIKGVFVDGVFVAEEALAKHDENYMPPEAAEALRAAETLRSSNETQ